MLPAIWHFLGKASCLFVLFIYILHTSFVRFSFSFKTNDEERIIIINDCNFHRTIATTSKSVQALTWPCANCEVFSIQSVTSGRSSPQSSLDGITNVSFHPTGNGNHKFDVSSEKSSIGVSLENILNDKKLLQVRKILPYFIIFHVTTVNIPFVHVVMHLWHNAKTITDPRCSV